MLRVAIDLIPGGFEPLRRRVASMTITNISDLADRSDYTVDAIEGVNPIAGLQPTNMHATIKQHDRRQSVWALVAKAAGVISQKL